MKERIKRAILETLVVENKQSIHHAVDKIIDILVANKSTEQKIKDFLYSQATPEVLRAIEYSIKNPSAPSTHPTHNIDAWKIEMTLIPGMVAPKK